MRAFDFDKTIFARYSFERFCFYSAARRPWTYPYLIVTLGGCILRLVNIINTQTLVNIAIRPYLKYDGIEKHIEDFWEKNFRYMHEPIRSMLNVDDVIISASPRFFLEIPAAKLGIKHLIGSEIDFEKKKIIDPYCYGEGKWKMFTERFGEDAVLDEYYTDSKRDGFMLKKAKKGYLVKKGNIIKIIG